MLHVNYFGVDPKHPLYEQFERYQVRDPWGDHDRQWWIWDRAEPEIRFAYINPACRRGASILCGRWRRFAGNTKSTPCTWIKRCASTTITTA